jgi:hypothetical protein
MPIVGEERDKVKEELKRDLIAHNEDIPEP